ncbi:MAG: hypothetical protein GY694_00655 [Gammaproteobacteria bacterium]|nr:hypothetical protein [Gammaproteobacteria bacterium]
MKKTMIALALSLFFSAVNLQASDMEFLRNMAHANPVPNYMSIIKKNAAKLELNKEQTEKVMVWKKKNGPKMAAMVQSVIDGEMKIRMASIDGISQKEITAMADELMDTRKKIILGKTTCRDYMMNVLTDSQWKQLAGIVKAK